MHIIRLARAMAYRSPHCRAMRRVRSWRCHFRPGALAGGRKVPLLALRVPLLDVLHRLDDTGAI